MTGGNWKDVNDIDVGAQRKAYENEKAARQAGITTFPNVKSFQTYHIGTGADGFSGILSGSFEMVDANGVSMEISFIPRTDGQWLYQFRNSVNSGLPATADGSGTVSANIIVFSAIISEVVSGTVLAQHDFYQPFLEHCTVAPMVMANVKAGKEVRGRAYVNGSNIRYYRGPSHMLSIGTFTPAN